MLKGGYAVAVYGGAAEFADVALVGVVYDYLCCLCRSAL